MKIIYFLLFYFISLSIELNSIQNILNQIDLANNEENDINTSEIPTTNQPIIIPDEYVKSIENKCFNYYSIPDIFELLKDYDIEIPTNIPGSFLIKFIQLYSNAISTTITVKTDDYSIDLILYFNADRSEDEDPPYTRVNIKDINYNECYLHTKDEATLERLKEIEEEIDKYTYIQLTYFFLLFIEMKLLI